MTLYIIIIIMWVLLGVVSLVPYMNPEELGQMSSGKKLLTLLIFIVLGPLIALSTFLHLLLFYYFGGQGEP